MFVILCICCVVYKLNSKTNIFTNIILFLVYKLFVTHILYFVIVHGLGYQLVLVWLYQADTKGTKRKSIPNSVQWKHNAIKREKLLSIVTYTKHKRFDVPTNTDWSTPKLLFTCLFVNIFSWFYNNSLNYYNMWWICLLSTQALIFFVWSRNDR